jgi:hypothetical protein
MKRTTLLTPLAALGIAAALALAGQAQAGPRISVGITLPFGPAYRPYPAYRHHHHHHHAIPVRVAVPVVPVAPVAPVAPVPVVPVVPRAAHYHVLYRDCPYSAWQEYGAYDCHDAAHRVERSLLYAGYQTRVVHH